MTGARSDGPDLIRRVAAGLRAGDQDAQEFAARLQDYLDGAHAGLTMDEAVGVATAPGTTPWWVAEAKTRRDDFLRLFVARFLGGRSDATEALVAEIRRYQRGARQHDRHRREMPAAYVGRPRELLFRAFRESPDDMPTSDRHIRRILNRCAERQISDTSSPLFRSAEAPDTPTIEIAPAQTLGSPHAVVGQTNPKLAQRRRRRSRR